MITGNFLLGTDFRHQAWTLTGRNFDLLSLVGDDFASFLKVQMGEQEVDEKHELKLDFALPVTDEQKRPSVKGTAVPSSRRPCSGCPSCACWRP